MAIIFSDCQLQGYNYCYETKKFVACSIDLPSVLIVNSDSILVKCLKDLEPLKYAMIEKTLKLIAELNNKNRKNG